MGAEGGGETVDGPDGTGGVGLPGAQLPCGGGVLEDWRHGERSDDQPLEAPEGGVKVPGSGR